MNSRELFNSIKDNQVKFDEAIKKQNEFLNKLSIIKIGKKTNNQKEVINNLENFYISLLNEIRQIVYFLYQSKQITKKYTRA